MKNIILYIGLLLISFMAKAQVGVDNIFVLNNYTYKVTQPLSGQGSSGAVMLIQIDRSSVIQKIPTRVYHEGIPYNVTAIADSVFYNDTLLHTIFIPTSVDSIGDYAFACNLRAVYIEKTTPPLTKSNSFCAHTDSLYVTRGNLGSYAPWNTIFSHINTVAIKDTSIKSCGTSITWLDGNVYGKLGKPCMDSIVLHRYTVDSMIIANISVGYPTRKIDTVSITSCSSYTYTKGTGRVVTFKRPQGSSLSRYKVAPFRDTIQNYMGCDSIFWVQIWLIRPVSIELEAAGCENLKDPCYSNLSVNNAFVEVDDHWNESKADSYYYTNDLYQNIFNVNYNQSSTAQDAFYNSSVSKCILLVRNLFIYHPNTYYLYDTLCAGKTKRYTFQDPINSQNDDSTNDVQYDFSALYTKNGYTYDTTLVLPGYIGEDGAESRCDSTVYMKIYVLPGVLDTIDTTICQGTLLSLHNLGISFVPTKDTTIRCEHGIYGCDTLTTLYVRIEDSIHMQFIRGSKDTIMCMGNRLDSLFIKYTSGYPIWIEGLDASGLSYEPFNDSVYVISGYPLQGHHSYRVIQDYPCGLDTLEGVFVVRDSIEIAGDPQNTKFCYGDAIDVKIIITDIHQHLDGITKSAGSDAIQYIIDQDTIHFRNAYFWTGTTQFMIGLLDSCNNYKTLPVTIVVMPEPKITIDQNDLYQSMCQGMPIDSIVMIHNDNATVRTINLPSELNASHINDTTFVIEGQLQTAGTYHYSIVITDNNEGCQKQIDDSIYLRSVVQESVALNICQRELPYIWNDSVFTEAGIKQTVLTSTSFGCDSTVIMQLFVNPTQTMTVYDTVCENSMVQTAMHLFSAANDTIVYDSLISVNTGCDSIITTNIKVNPIQRTFLNYKICRGAPLTQDDIFTTFDSDTTLVDSLVSITGCDSIVTTTVSILQEYAVTEVRNLCETEFKQVYASEYHWNDSIFYGSGTLTTPLQSSLGCDSLVTMVLQIIPEDTTFLYDTTCRTTLLYSSPTHLNYVDLNVDTVGLITIDRSYTSRYGCDSVVRFLLYIQPQIDGPHIHLNICSDDLPYNYNGTWITESVSDTLHYSSQNYCDSVVYLNAIVREALLDTTIYACDSYLSPNGKLYNSDTIFNLIYAGGSAYGCDSVITVHLIIRESQRTTLTDSICQGQTYLKYGFYVKPEETDTAKYITKILNLNTVEGCDSTVVLHLFVRTNYYVIKEIGYELPFEWIINGDTVGSYYADTVVWYHDTTAAAYPCDEIVYELNFEVFNGLGAVVEHAYVDTCKAYTWINGETYYQSTDVLRECGLTSNGLYDSIQILHLTITSITKTIYLLPPTIYNGIEYRSDTILWTPATNPEDCDTLYIIKIFQESILVNKKNWLLLIDHNKLNDRIYVPYSECCSQYKWYESGNPIENKFQGKDYYTYDSIPLTPGACYYVIITLNDGASLVKSESVCIPVRKNEAVEKLIVYPNPVLSHDKITVRTTFSEEQLKEAELFIYNSRGEIVMQQPMEQPEIECRIYDFSGTYILHLRMKNGNDITTKVIVK